MHGTDVRKGVCVVAMRVAMCVVAICVVAMCVRLCVCGYARHRRPSVATFEPPLIRSDGNSKFECGTDLL